MSNNEIENEELSYPKMERVEDFQSPHNYMFRLCLLGDANVGKTSLLTRFCDSTFKENYCNTIGVDFRVVTLSYQDVIAKVHIWDTAGQERFKSLATNYFKTTHGFIFVYDISDLGSFHHIEEWYDAATKNIQRPLINILIGNKSDLESKRQIKKEDGEDFAKRKNCLFLETSAKNNENVDRIFEYMTYKLIKFFSENKEKYVDDENSFFKLDSKSEEIETTRPENGNCNC